MKNIYICCVMIMIKKKNINFTNSVYSKCLDIIENKSHK